MVLAGKIYRRGMLAIPIALSLMGAACTKVGTAEANGNVKPDSQSEPSSVSRWFSSTHPVTLPEGAPLSIRTTSTLSTKANRTGEEFRGSLEEPLLVGGAVVAPRGAGVSGVIADSDPGGRVKGRARLGVRLTGIETTASGGSASKDITTNTVWYEARATKGKDAAKIGIGAGVGALIGGLVGGGKGAAIGAGAGGGAGTGVVLATRGDPAVIPAESVLTFALAAPLTVDVKN
jgi:hypothetical protein